MRKKDKEKIIKKVLFGKVENNLEKEVYLEYLNEELKNLKVNNIFDNLVLIKDAFVDLLENYKEIYNEKYELFGYFFTIGFLIGCIATSIELAILGTLKNLYFLKSSIGFASIPVIFSLIIATISTFKFYISEKIQLILRFIDHKKELKEKIKDVKELEFEKEETKEQDNHKILDDNERYILNDKEKTKIYERINDLLKKIKGLPESKEKTYYALELTSIVMDFDNKRINLENLNSNNQNLIIDNKVNVELYILQRLNNLESQINSFLNKENRMEEDKVKVKTILDELKPLTRK